MFTITTTQTTTGSYMAKGHGKQRTVKPVGDSADARHGAAVGALLAVLTDDRQKAMLLHPSGKQRVRVKVEDEGRARWTVNV
jgi:hypothetical protein